MTEKSIASYPSHRSRPDQSIETREISYKGIAGDKSPFHSQPDCSFLDAPRIAAIDSVKVSAKSVLSVVSRPNHALTTIAKDDVARFNKNPVGCIIVGRVYEYV